MILEHPNFRENDATYVIRCQKCGRENYVMAVQQGVCCWCGEDHNKYEVKDELETRPREESEDREQGATDNGEQPDQCYDLPW